MIFCVLTRIRAHPGRRTRVGNGHSIGNQGTSNSVSGNSFIGAHELNRNPRTTLCRRRQCQLIQLHTKQFNMSRLCEWFALNLPVNILRTCPLTDYGRHTVESSLYSPSNSLGNTRLTSSITAIGALLASQSNIRVCQRYHARHMSDLYW